jgi:hypothetical protein
MLFLGLVLAAGAGVADTARADPKLDEASESTAKAIELLKAAHGKKGQDDFEAHRKKAVDLLTRARGEILKAKRE